MTSCGCTAATMSTKVIAPLHSGRINVSLMADVPGDDEKDISIQTSRGVQQIHVTYHVVAPLHASVLTATASAIKEDQK